MFEVIVELVFWVAVCKGVWVWYFLFGREGFIGAR